MVMLISVEFEELPASGGVWDAAIKQTANVASLLP
jgi:hypothetical protein